MVMQMNPEIYFNANDTAPGYSASSPIRTYRNYGYPIQQPLPSWVPLLIGIAIATAICAFAVGLAALYKK